MCHIYVGEVKKRPKTPKQWDWVGLRELTDTLDRDILALAGRGMQLLDWDRNHAFCGVCGAQTQLLEIERCRKCSACGHLSYPKIAPVVMALVRKGEKLLLGRSAHFSKKIYSVLAGYVDPGESLEQAVAREVREEVGVMVQNPVYFASQPWPFSGSSDKEISLPRSPLLRTVRESFPSHGSSTFKTLDEGPGTSLFSALSQSSFIGQHMEHSFFVLFSRSKATIDHHMD